MTEAYGMAAMRRLTVSTIAGLACWSLAASEASAGGKPGVFDYYTLTLSWSPTWCETDGKGRREPQCEGSRPYAFVLHGLWPQYSRGWPQECDTGAKPWVPRKVIDSVLDIMPSTGLVIHEYRKHGTCSGLEPEAYYAAAREMFEQVRIPARYLSPTDYVTVTPAQIEEDFLKTNPELTADMLSISCGRERRLREVRICFSRDRKPTPCGVNEDQAKLCKLEKIVLPPVRLRSD
ncbi:MAG: ribonuclease T2 [Pseudomonadota bacterium]|nr:ribonuclease T2 [Pseudomonadota bacterium]